VSEDDGSLSAVGQSSSTQQQVGGLKQQQQQQQRRLSAGSSVVSLNRDLSELLAELSGRQTHIATSTTAASANKALVLISSSSGSRSQGHAAASKAQAPGHTAAGTAAAAGHHGRLSNYSDVSLFSVDSETTLPSQAAPGADNPPHTAATAGGARVGQQQQQQQQQGGLKSARISGDSQASSFSLGGSDIDIDYDELASLGINLTGPAPGRQQQQQQQQQQHKGPPARPATSFGLPPKPQQQQQRGPGLRQPRGVTAVGSAGTPADSMGSARGGAAGVGGAAGQQQPMVRPAQPAASAVFYGHVSGAPMRNAGSYY
jgi:hypothetical protein